MRGLLGTVTLVGLVVMLYYGRVTWMSGGGVVLPHLSARMQQTLEGPELLLMNTGTEKLEQVEILVPQVDPDRRFAVCAVLMPQQEIRIPLPVGIQEFRPRVYAARYPLPAQFYFPGPEKE